MGTPAASAALGTPVQPRPRRRTGGAVDVAAPPAEPLQRAGDIDSRWIFG
jgi:hypothetical protein